MSSLVQYHSAIRDRDPRQEALERAKKLLGDKYLLYPANHVKRLERPYGSPVRIAADSRAEGN